jgi:fumarate hydratase subunit beta
MKIINLPISKSDIKDLKIGEEVFLSGTIYTARDAAHKRMEDTLNRGEKLPIEIEDACIYYAGPCPAKPGQVIGSCGPTTSSRMDAYAPRFYDLKMGCVIGKGPVGQAVKEAIKRNKSCYFAATGGAGALIGSSIKKVSVVAYEDLGAESIKKMEVVDLPAIVAVKDDEDIFNIKNK